jgi:hypothetical protein
MEGVKEGWQRPWIGFLWCVVTESQSRAREKLT